MTKKVRRVRRPGRASREEESTTVQPSVQELQKEYAYVLQDLRRVFILAAAMFLLLIVINLLI